MSEEAPKGSLLDSLFDKTAHAIDDFISGGHGGHGHGEHSFIQKWLSLHEWVEWAGGHGISRGTFLCSLFLPLPLAATALIPEFPRLLFGWIAFLFPIAGPVGFGYGFWTSWVWYVQSNFIFTRTRPVLLEVKMPQDITKSPRAMEQVFTNLWIRMSTTTPIDQYWSGGVLPYFSFEIASFGGQIHFYIWSSRDILKNVIESNMYAQYPEVEIVEVEDYSIRFHYDHNEYQAFVGDYAPEGYTVSYHSDSINAYPIKTYVDFELDKDPKEELKVEPLSSVLEVLGALNPNEQAWIQIVIRGHFSKDKWRKTVEGEVEKIRRASTKLQKIEGEPEDEDAAGFPRPTWKQSELIRSMERQLGKMPFDYGMRMLYIAPRGKMRGGEYSAIRWIWRPYGNPNYQVYIRPKHAHNDFDWPWQDFRGTREEHETHRYLDAYRRRQVFHAPWKAWWNTTSVETLATLWHPPSRTVQAPGLQRIPSSKAEPPPNLPF